MTRVKDNFDINIWNRGAYFEEAEPEWVLCAYALEEKDAGYGTGQYFDELNLVLTNSEVFDLTLGWAPNLGGDYIDEDDFWLDMQSFKQTYKDIPPRVQEWFDTVLAVL